MEDGDDDFRKVTIKMTNATLWDPNEPDKLYLDNVQLVIVSLPFVCRQVNLIFEEGRRRVELTTFDMDRLVAEYLKLREIKVPEALSAANDAEPPSRLSFVLSPEQASEMAKFLNPRADSRRDTK